MKYFTADLWQRTQYSDTAREWERAYVDYKRDLDALQRRLSPEAAEFFEINGPHDGELLDFRVIDGSRPAPLGEEPRQVRAQSEYPVRVRLSVLDAPDEFVWFVSYSGVSRIETHYSSKGDGLRLSEGQGFGDWGYHELSDAGAGFLRHEILFASGSTILVEFKEVIVERIPRDLAAQRMGK